MWLNSRKHLCLFKAAFELHPYHIIIKPSLPIFSKYQYFPERILVFAEINTRILFSP